MICFPDMCLYREVLKIHSCSNVTRIVHKIWKEENEMLCRNKELFGVFFPKALKLFRTVVFLFLNSFGF